MGTAALVKTRMRATAARRRNPDKNNRPGGTRAAPSAPRWPPHCAPRTNVTPLVAPGQITPPPTAHHRRRLHPVRAAGRPPRAPTVLLIHRARTTLPRLPKARMGHRPTATPRAIRVSPAPLSPRRPLLPGGRTRSRPRTKHLVAPRPRGWRPKPAGPSRTTRRAMTRTRPPIRGRGLRSRMVPRTKLTL